MRPWIITTLVACSTPTFDAQVPEWTLDASVAAEHVATTPSGDLIILAFAGFSLAGEDVGTNTFVRVSPSGEIIARVPFVVEGGVEKLIGVADDGSPRVLSMVDYNPTVAAFDAAFAPQWHRKGLGLSRCRSDTESVGPSGATALCSYAGSAGNLLFYLAADGTVTWRQSEQSILVYMGADDHVYSHVPQASGEQLRVHRDSTGAIVDAIATPYFGTPTQYLPDGSMMMGMTRYASDLTVAWTADYGQDFAIPFMAANNQLFAITRAGVEVARYDGATGHLMERHENAAARGARIVWGDDAGYVLLHETGFTRYAGP